MQVTDAIILKKEGVGEADLLITALTPDFVRIRLVAQGARKVGAKLKGHLEPLSLSRLSFVAGRNNYRLVGAELQNFFPKIKSDPERLKIALEIVSILDSALFEDVAPGGGGFFELTHDALSFLDNPSRSLADCRKALLWFRARFLKESGLLPEGLIPEAAHSVGFIEFAERTKLAELEEAVSRIFNGYLPAKGRLL